MKPRLIITALLSLGLALPALAASTEAQWRQTAPADGWASAAGGTTGGSAAKADHVFRVRDIEGFRKAIAPEEGNPPRIVVVEGVIDATGGAAFANSEDQQARLWIKLPSNLTLIGADRNAGFLNTNLVLKGVENVIIRNLTIETPWDAFPVWDPKDGPTGHWNSEYDGISIEASSHLWIDHVHIGDGRRTDDQNGLIDGHEVQHHDGALDIKRASDYITISWSIFRLHDKTNIIGHSDKNADDAGHLLVTFHHNLWDNVTQRAPRVRYGQVHVYNNLYQGSRKHPVYPYQYSHGVGVESRILSEANLFEIEGARDVCDVVKGFGGKRYEDRGSVLNGKPLDSSVSCKGFAGGFQPVEWTPPYTYALSKPEALPALLKAGAGPQ